MTTIDLDSLGVVLFDVAERLKLHLPTRYYLAPNPEEMIAILVAEVEASFTDWEEVYETAVEDAKEWHAKYLRCRDQRNRLSQILKLIIMDGVITKDGISVLKEMTD